MPGDKRMFLMDMCFNWKLPRYACSHTSCPHSSLRPLSGGKLSRILEISEFISFHTE